MTTKKQKKWLTEYFNCWNETEAARRADYAWPNKQGSRLAKKFAGEIKEHIEKTQMSADEALLQLGQIARLDIGDFLKFEPGIKEPYLDLPKAKDAGLLKLVKKIKYNAQGHLEIELYDKQAAIVQIGKWQGLTERQEITGPDGGPQEVKIDFSNLTDEQLNKLTETAKHLQPAKD